MTSHQKTRRNLLAGLTGLIGANTLSNKAMAAVLTPTATEGPFYPTNTMRRTDIDNDLVKIAGRITEAGGEVITLRGKIVNSDGEPRQGLRIEIWQCDVDGNYMHPQDRNSVHFDTAFQGFGHDITGPDGSYSFRTIKPTTYPGRTPHIHVKVLKGDRELLTTQFYIKDHPQNEGDWLYGRMNQAEAASVSMEFIQRDSGEETVVNIVL